MISVVLLVSAPSGAGCSMPEGALNPPAAVASSLSDVRSVRGPGTERFRYGEEYLRRQSGVGCDRRRLAHTVRAVRQGGLAQVIMDRETGRSRASVSSRWRTTANTKKSDRRAEQHDVPRPAVDGERGPAAGEERRGGGGYGGSVAATAVGAVAVAAAAVGDGGGHGYGGRGGTAVAATAATAAAINVTNHLELFPRRRHRTGARTPVGRLRLLEWSLRPWLPSLFARPYRHPLLSRNDAAVNLPGNP